MHQFKRKEKDFLRPTAGKRSTAATHRGESPPTRPYVHQQGKAGHPLHGQNEERDHGQVPAVFVGLDSRQHFLERGVGGSDKSKEEMSIHYLVKLRSNEKQSIKCCDKFIYYQ